MERTLEEFDLEYTSAHWMNDPISALYKRQFPFAINFNVGNSIDAKVVSDRIIDYCINTFPDYFSLVGQTVVKGFALDPNSKVIGAVTNSGYWLI